MDALPAALKAFFAEADVQTVISIALLTRLLEISLLATWQPWKNFGSWLPFLFSFLLTPLMSTSDEARWGGRYYYRAVMYNATGAVFFLYVVVPQLHALYGKWRNGPKNGPT